VAGGDTAAEGVGETALDEKKPNFLNPVVVGGEVATCSAGGAALGEEVPPMATPRVQLATKFVSGVELGEVPLVSVPGVGEADKV